MYASLLGLFKMTTPNPNKFVPGHWVKAAKQQINQSSNRGQNFNSRQQHESYQSYRNLNENQPRYLNQYQRQNSYSATRSYSTSNYNNNNDLTNNIKRKYSRSADFMYRKKPQVLFRNLRSRAHNQDEYIHTRDKGYDTPSTSQPILHIPITNQSQSCHELSTKKNLRIKHKRGEEQLARDWLTTDKFGNKLRLSKVPLSGDNDFNIMSYNMLSQRLLENNMFLYKDCNQDVLGWEFRWNNLRREMEGYNTDIVCLQEVENTHFSKHIAPWLESRGYQFAYKKRSGYESSKPDGVLTAWKVDKFKLLISKPVEYYRSAHKLTRCHNVGLISMLRMKNGKHICVGNTHLLYNPKRGDIKLIQLAILFAEINKVMNFHTSRTGSKPPLVVCGDFNSTPRSPLYKFITKGRLCYKDMGIREISGQGGDENGGPGTVMEPKLIPDCLEMNSDSTFVQERGQTNGQDYNLSHHLGLLHSSGHDHKAFETTTMQNKGVTVDFIFYTPPPYRSKHNLRRGGSSLEIKGQLSKILAGEINEVNGIPNHVHSSDHLPVISQFQFK